MVVRHSRRGRNVTFSQFTLRGVNRKGSAIVNARENRHEQIANAADCLILKGNGNSRFRIEVAAMGHCAGLRPKIKQICDESVELTDHVTRGEPTHHPTSNEGSPATIFPAVKEASAFKLADTAAWKWVAPLLVYMALPMFLERFGLMSISHLQFAGPRPTPSDWGGLTVLLIQVFVAGGLLVYLAPAYLRLLPWRVSWMAVPLGLVGLALWVGICELRVEQSILNLIPSLTFFEAARPSVNPAESFPEAFPYLLFLLFRFVALAMVVPVAEEVLLRGFFIRMMQEDEWWRLPMNRLALSAVGVSAIYGAMTHPNEWLAAIVWFAAVTLWIRWTNRFWDGVVIHAVTNLALGIYVMTYQQWHLW